MQDESTIIAVAPTTITFHIAFEKGRYLQKKKKKKKRKKKCNLKKESNGFVSPDIHKDADVYEDTAEV